METSSPETLDGYVRQLLARLADLQTGEARAAHEAVRKLHDERRALGPRLNYLNVDVDDAEASLREARATLDRLLAQVTRTLRRRGELAPNKEPTRQELERALKASMRASYELTPAYEAIGCFEQALNPLGELVDTLRSERKDAEARWAKLKSEFEEALAHAAELADFHSPSPE